MAFIDTVMPRRLVSGFEMAYKWSTFVQEMDNGKEFRDQEWMFAKLMGRGDISALSDAERIELLGLMMACRGRAHAFRFFNPLDFQASAQPLLTIAGVTYLAKGYVFGAETAYRLIHAPRAGATVTSGTIDFATGKVTGASPGATWSGQFDTWMRFDSDEVPVVATTTRVLSASIDLVEVSRR